MDPCRIFAGNASRRLAQSICDGLQVPLGDAEVGRFEDGEVSVRFNENIRGSDVFIVQTTGAPADNLMELLVMLDAAKRASARRVTAVMPYFGYARQDRKDQPRAPISAKLVANLITVAGADRVLTPASLAALRDINVTPAPVSTAKLNGPTELIQVSTSKPRPWTSRNVTERGSEIVRGAVAGFALLCCALD